MLRMRMNRPRWHNRLLASFLLALALMIAMLVILEVNIRPLVFDMAEAKVRAIAVKAVNDAVDAVMENDVRYTDLMNVVTDDDGHISLIQANTVQMNVLASNTAVMSQENIIKAGSQGISIPIGTAIGSDLMSGRGPSIVVKVIPVGSVQTQFVTEFENAGINQTRHKIFLLTKTNIRVIIPTGSRTVEVDQQVLIAENIIIGQVPQSYTYIDNYNLFDVLS